jgi:branched-chain amino acid transport system permease protein
MSEVGQLLVAGIAIGSVYALVALGFVLIYRATNVVNFAQGDLAMLGAYALLVTLTVFHLPFWLAGLVSLGVMAVVGILFGLGLYYPLRNRGFMPIIVATIGASVLFENGIVAGFGASPHVVTGMFGTGSFHIGSVFVNDQYALLVGILVVVTAFQFWFFEGTLLGKKMQAVSQDKQMALLLGIPVGLMIVITFSYSTALAGLAGVLVSPVLFVSAGLGSGITMNAFAATVIGGFGDVTGAIVGGLVLGLVDTFGGAYISFTYEQGFGMAVVILFLLFRPQGLFGERVAEKA